MVDRVAVKDVCQLFTESATCLIKCRMRYHCSNKYDCTADMGHHYTPKAYLRRFTNADGGLWLHDRKRSVSNPTTVDGVGHEVGLYSPKVESDLNLLVETPAHPVFEKIVSRQPLSAEDRRVLAKYIIVMYKRVPIARDRNLANIPALADELQTTLLRELDELSETDPTFDQWGEASRNEVKTYLKRVKENPSPALWYNNIRPAKAGRAEQTLLSMNWVFLHSKELQYLTSDNPVFIFDEIGIANPASELTFPISSSIALWATWQNEPDGSHRVALPAAVKQINRRTVHSSKRFVFSRDNEPWIMPFITKDEWQLQWLGRS
jgi:hypothetical protein